MREFIHKINSNKILKVVFCIVIAIPIWLIVMLIGFNSSDTDNVPAEVVISTEPTVTVKPNNENTTATPDEVKEELLNYTSSSDEQYLRVMTVGDIDFTEEYVTTTIREQMFTEIFETGMFKNISRDQITNIKIEKYSGDKDAFIETGYIKDKQYAASYTLVGKNLVYAAAFYDASDPQSLAIKNAKTVIKGVNLYIQYARKSQ